MSKLLTAEWRKLWGNRRVVGCALVIWPAIALGAAIGYLLLNLLNEELRQHPLTSWNDIALGVWEVPTNFLGRIAVLMVAAVIFGGEYQWHTWKSIVPRRSRVQIMAAKFFTLGAVIVLVFTLMSLLFTGGLGVANLLVSAPYGPAPTLSVVGDFLARFGVRAGLTFVDTLIVGAIAALASLAGRSIAVGAFGSLTVLFVDSLLPAGALTLASLFDSNLWLEILRLQFTYNLTNLSVILQGGAPIPATPLAQMAGRVVGTNSLALSFAIVTVWLVGLVGLTLWLFQRQDLTE